MKRSGKCNQKHKCEVQVLLQSQELLVSLVVTCKNISYLLLGPPVLLDVVPCSDKENSKDFLIKKTVSLITKSVIKT